MRVEALPVVADLDADVVVDDGGGDEGDPLARVPGDVGEGLGRGVHQGLPADVVRDVAGHRDDDLQPQPARVLAHRPLKRA